MRRITGLATIAAATLWVAAPALAYQDQISLGVEAGYAGQFGDNALGDHGVALGLSSALGLDDTWMVRAHALYAYHPGTLPWHASLFGAELIYVLDVIEWIPFFGLGAHGMLNVADGEVSADGAGNLVLGLDYVLSRDTVVGLDIRPFVVLSALETRPAYLTVTLRLEWLFDM
ncbi:MAG: hypothetical protein H6715_04100 [Myxococcales bacterium]|nr:hypothetical protein [Myxococcales bacterium]MCB9708614.1 hypothetical protein [Myxococcales bacterium]